MKPNEWGNGCWSKILKWSPFHRWRLGCPKSELEIGCASGYLKKSHWKSTFCIGFHGAKVAFSSRSFQTTASAWVWRWAEAGDSPTNGLISLNLVGSRPWADPWSLSEIRLKVVEVSIFKQEKQRQKGRFSRILHYCSQCCTCSC